LPKLRENLSRWLFTQILCCRARIASYVFLPDTAAMKSGAIFGIKAARIRWREERLLLWHI